MLKPRHRYQSPMALDLAVLHLYVIGSAACILLDIAWQVDSKQARSSRIIGATPSIRERKRTV